MIKKQEDINAWELARTFALKVFHKYNEEPFTRDFGLKNRSTDHRFYHGQHCRRIWQIRKQRICQFSNLCHSQKPAANSQLPIANRQKLTASRQQPTANRQQPTANCQSPTANCQKPTANS